LIECVVRKFIIATLLLVCFGVLFAMFIKSNLEYTYFEFKNNTDRTIILSVDYYYRKNLSFSEHVPPFAEKEIRVRSAGREVVDFKVYDLSNEEISQGDYLSYGRSFFFKTKYRYEYDGEKINVIYDSKIDYWF